MNAETSQPTTRTTSFPAFSSRCPIVAAVSTARSVVGASASGSIGESQIPSLCRPATSPAIRIRSMSTPVIRTALACRPVAISPISRSIVALSSFGRVVPRSTVVVPMS